MTYRTSGGKRHSASTPAVAGGEAGVEPGELAVGEPKAPQTSSRRIRYCQSASWRPRSPRVSIWTRLPVIAVQLIGKWPPAPGPGRALERGLVVRAVAEPD